MEDLRDLNITSSTIEGSTITIRGHNKKGDPVEETLNLPADGSTVTTENVMYPPSHGIISK